MNDAELQVLPTAFDQLGAPEVENITYDLWELRVTLRFESQRNPVYVVFNAPSGFRVLDEGDLSSLWLAPGKQKGWIWRVRSGGWRDLECKRKDFILAEAMGHEYLVGGINDCVSVLAQDPPRVYSPETEQS